MFHDLALRTLLCCCLAFWSINELASTLAPLSALPSANTTVVSSAAPSANTTLNTSVQETPTSVQETSMNASLNASANTSMNASLLNETVASASLSPALSANVTASDVSLVVTKQKAVALQKQPALVGVSTSTEAPKPPVRRTSRKSSTSTVFPTSTVKHVLMSTCKLRLDKAAEEEIATQYVQVDSGAFGGGIHDVHAAKKLLECL
eukprot:m.251003 g.251003  ORF g.251003 m.251003 type:complete len:207 (-) comp15445_c4_seq18:992-1612(-)